MIGWWFLICVGRCMLSIRYPWLVSAGYRVWITLHPRVRDRIPATLLLVILCLCFLYLKGRHHNRPPLLVDRSSVFHKFQAQNHLPLIIFWVNMIVKKQISLSPEDHRLQPHWSYPTQRGRRGLQQAGKLLQQQQMNDFLENPHTLFLSNSKPTW